jgi:hypothetical protein
MKISRFHCFWASTRTTCACFPVWDCQPAASCPFSAHCWMTCPSVTTISLRARPSPGSHAACKPPATLFTFCADRKARPNTKLSPNLYLPFLLSTLKGSYWPLLSALLLLRPCCPSGLLKDHFSTRWFVIVVNLSILPCVSRFLGVGVGAYSSGLFLSGNLSSLLWYSVWIRLSFLERGFYVKVYTWCGRKYHFYWSGAF